jgi:hypothetical protein
LRSLGKVRKFGLVGDKLIVRKTVEGVEIAR